jgi:hypothetical protein
MRTPRCQRVNRTFETVEDVGTSGHRHGEGSIVFISADFALRHIWTLNLNKFRLDELWQARVGQKGYDVRSAHLKPLLSTLYQMGGCWRGTIEACPAQICSIKIWNT